MILFAPAYDDATDATCRLAERFADEATVVLLRHNATRTNLLDAVSAGEGDDGVLAFSHGTEGTLAAQDSAVALDAHDASLLEGRRVLAYACHTSTGLGEVMARGGVVWWGYTGTILAPPEGSGREQIFGPVFDYLVGSFLSGVDRSGLREVFTKLRALCHHAEKALYVLFDSGVAGLEDFGCLLHIWNRLRVWLPGSDAPEHHPESTPIFVR
ncbi:MAG TPA: hypothetical protein VF584_00270 [Longimicrobium sp.]|jgi:hypothetical protein